MVNENQRSFIANTVNANKFFKFHAKYGWINVLLKLVVGLIYSMVLLAFISSYYRYLSFYEENRLSEDHWSNAPQQALYGSGDQIYERV